MSHRFVATVEFPGRYGRMKPGTYAIPGEISMGDAKAHRADGFGTIERDAQPQPAGGNADQAAAPFPPGYEHKEQPAARPDARAPDILPPAAPVHSGRGRKRKAT